MVIGRISSSLQCPKYGEIYVVNKAVFFSIVDIDHLLHPYRSTYVGQNSFKVVVLGAIKVRLACCNSTSALRFLASRNVLKDSHFCFCFPYLSV